MRIGVLIQARMHSRGCPGKSLAPLGPRSVLGHVIRRCRGSELACEVAVATTVDHGDDMLTEFCGYNGVRCFRGPTGHVAQRLALALNQLGWTACVRIFGDCPLIDSRLIDDAIRRFAVGDVDLVTNTRGATFPLGQEVELIRSSLLCQRAPFMTHGADSELVTPWFYRRIPSGRVGLLRCDREWSGADVSMKVNRVDDLERLRQLHREVGSELFDMSWHEVVEAMSPTQGGLSRTDEELAA